MDFSIRPCNLKDLLSKFLDLWLKPVTILMLYNQFIPLTEEGKREEDAKNFKVKIRSFIVIFLFIVL